MFKAVHKDEIKVPGHIDYLGELRNFVTKTGKKHGFSDSVVNAFKLSIDEAATNIIKHAYRDWEGEITLRVVVKKNSLTVILIDQGKYFDPAKMKNPDLQRYVDIGKKGGLGIFIMRRLIDEIDYRHTEEGNELRLTKFRDGDFRKREEEKDKQQEKQTTSTLSLSLKSSYSLISAGILTLIITIGYMYFYVVKGKQITDDILAFQKSNSVNIANTVLEPGESVLSTLYIGTHLGDAVDLDERPEIYRVIIVDSENFCQYSTDDELTYTAFNIPEDHKEIYPGIYQYNMNDGVEVYDIVSPILDENDEKIGQNHLQIKKEYVQKQVAKDRAEYLKLAVLILLMGYAGIAILIYIVMNPFRKLSDWVKELGHGEVAEDEYDFDTGNELGEIAKAFSEITDKFRKSQANLAEQERLQKEMQLAQDIQQTLLPTSVPQLEGYEISSFYASAKEVGGDYYDFVEVDKDSLGIVVADVSGKGVPGSLIMTMIRTALRTEARGVKSASEVLARLNNFVVKDMKKGMFVTIYYVIIDSKKRRLNYASAGHNPMILFRQTTDKTYYLNPKGFPVGISLPDQDLFKKSIESDTIQLAEDDILLIYTDGITEAMNNRRELFGEERLLDTIRKNSKLRVEPFTEKIKDEIYSFTQGFEQNDDITLVAIKEKSSPEKIEYQRAQKAHNLILNGKNIRDACEEAGITTYAYYNKYKKIFEEEGVEAYSIDDTISLESKHFSIEEKTQIYDIIKQYPEYGAKRISEELNSEKYGFTKINENRIYDELVRSRLNTRQLREAYVARSGKKKRMKPPGTPMLTLDGRIILDREQYEVEEEDVEMTPEETPIEKEKKQPIRESDHSTKKTEKPAAKELEDDFLIENLISTPIEDLLEKKRPTVDYQDSNQGGMTEPDNAQQEELLPADKIEEEDDVTQIAEANTQSKEEDIEIDHEEEAGDKEIDDSFGHMFYEGTTEDVEYEELPDDTELPETGDKVGVNEEEIAKTEDDRPESTDEETDTNDDLLEIEDNYEIEDGIEHDFSFKDIWEENIEIIDDQTEQDEQTTSDQMEDQDKDHAVGDAKIEELDSADDKVTDNEKENLADVEQDKTELNEDLFELNDDKFKTSMDEVNTDDETDQFSFTDLLDKVGEEVSFYNSEIEVREEFISDSTDSGDDDEPSVVSEISNEENLKLDQMLKEKHLLLGLKLYKENNYDDAIEEFKQVLQIYPDFKEVHSILGNAYFRNEMSDLAMNEYQRVIEIDPYDVNAYENIGVIYANWGEYSKAITEWEKLLEIDGSRADIRKNVEKAKNILQNVNENI